VTLIVLDASAVASWALPSQASDSAKQLLREAPRHSFIAPHIFPIEVRSVLLAAERRGGWTSTATATFLEDLNDLEIQTLRMDGRDDLSSVLQTARELRLSLYDAFYLRLAEVEAAVLASRDKALLIACAQRNLAVLDLNQ
jgi:predicted nucleic acid-binding protein